MRVNALLSTGRSSMHTQHVKFCAYVAGGAGVGRAVAVVLVFEEGEVSGLVEDDDDRSVLEVVVVVVSFLPSPSLLVVSFLAVVLLDCIGTVEGLIVFGARSVRLFYRNFFVHYIISF